VSIAEPKAIFTVGDARGRLSAIEAGRDVPFDIARVYYLTATQPEHPRGFHAHHATRQFAVCLRGGCRLVLEAPDGERSDLRLDSPESGILIDTMIWHEMHDFARDTILLVLADRHYEEADYIRSYDAWQELCRDAIA
jgi:dTDP-4-dehydrorhamnose 3,5-epimerase